MIHLVGAFMAQALAVRPVILSLTKAQPSQANPHDQMNRYSPAGRNFCQLLALKGCAAVANSTRRFIMASTAAIADTDSASVQVYILDVPAQQVAHWGRILPLPGDEAGWDAETPASISERMNRLL